MNIQDMQEFKTIREWMETVNPRPNTKRNYLTGMVKYCRFTGLNPDELLQEADEDIKAGILPRERRIKKRLISYRNWLDSQGLAINTKLNDMSGPRSFYKTFDHELPRLPKWERAKPKEEHLDIPTKEDIRQALQVCDLRNKAIILTGCSSGLSADEITNLKLDQFLKGYDDVTEICTLFIRRGKSGQDFVTFLSPETTRTINQYIEYRNRDPMTCDKREHAQRDKQRTYGNAGYLFIKKQVPNDYLDSYDEELRKLDTDGLLKAYRTLSANAGISTDKGIWNLVRSHNMRKFFNTTLKNAGFDSERVEYLMGHALDGVKGAYYRADSEKLREMYLKFVPYLTIQKELDVSKAKEYLEKVQENEKLRGEVVTHALERSELADMKRELEAQKKRQEDLNTILEKLKENPAILLEALGKVK
ncbi:tyrosine-type recombinase/integrase [Methanolobus sp. WCC5]|uniref:tyrosine-type recombinase/integrase n=1 Tax=Methanolobus sp. WCC5 TaxID=3125785 RepID=UPI00324CFB6A